ncbi:hypothetical protein [Gryllotalpicola protaetiae]|uniref:Uncharacterized protein n=1 Tax=Gryllotalpicola protaetiae TaxID=2419771 RepID=A0A387BMV6_9MICO|nr:hypothetical protein [Gryllotalpicola protaetiae]AYG02360.1 hypothetical protein D7I44_01640 [Gryllotalpicola protaetiae]
MTAPLPPAAPPVSNNITTIAYWVAFGAAAVALALDGIAPLWWPSIADKLTETVAVIVEAIVLIAAGLGAVISPLGRRSR